jgi:hypothetical protein
MQLERRVDGSGGRADSDPAARIQRLLRRKLSEKRRLDSDIEQMQRQLVELAPEVDRARELAADIHRLFGEAVRRPGLGRRDRQRIAALISDLEDLIGPDPEATLDEEPCDCPRCRPESNAGEPAGHAADATPSDADRASAARGQERDRSLRDLYRALARRYHPDHAGDDETRAQHTVRMREINDAFHGGDTDRLLELSRELGMDAGALRNARGVVAELVAQYERVKAEVRQLRESPLGQLLIETRHARRGGYPTPLETMRDEIHEQLAALAETRDHVARFVAGKLTVGELVAGPCADEPDEEVDEQVDEDLFLALVDLLEAHVAAAAAPARQRRGGPGRRKRRRRR